MPNYVHGQPMSSPPVHGGLIPVHGGLGPPVHGSNNSIAYGPELVTNGDFPVNTTGWTPNGGATLSVDTQRLKVLNVAGGTSHCSQSLAGLTNGATYNFRGTITPGPTSLIYGRFEFAGAHNATKSYELLGASIDFTFVAGSTSLDIYCENASSGAYNGAGDYTYFDNISLRRVL